MNKLIKEINDNKVSLDVKKNDLQKDFSQKLLDEVKGGGRWLKWIKNH